MFLHLGQDTLVNTRRIIGIFDLDTTSVSARTREFLARAERGRAVVNVSTELPKSFAVAAPPRTRRRGAAQGEKTRLYISQLSAATLKKRLDAAQQKQTIL